MIVRYWNCLSRGCEATKDGIHMQIRWFHFTQNKIFVKQIQGTRFRGRKSIKKSYEGCIFHTILGQVEKILNFSLSFNLFLADLRYLKWDILVAWNLVDKPKMTDRRRCALQRYHFMFYCLVTFIPCSTLVV